MSLTFRDFQDANVERCERAFGHIGNVDQPWGLSDWALAICGEAGELANIAKKIRRGDFTADDKRDELLAECADIITYTDILITYLGARTDWVVANKFNRVSQRVNWRHRL